ncbi:hypothetical protein TNCV_4901991 [Trichonephila clavipes]|nr:hypothetical protein TNCV_4901991 [Trichonephila clavipes]
MKLIERLIEKGGSDSSSRNFVSPKISENVFRLIGRHFPSYVESNCSKKTLRKCVALAVTLRFAATPSRRPPFATFFFGEASPSAVVIYIAVFLRLLRFLQVVFSVEIKPISSKNDVIDCENSIVIADEPCSAVFRRK